MAFPIDPGRPPGMIQPLENLVQGNVDSRAMLPLVPAREQQHHDVRQHAGLGHGQHDEQDMNLEDMLPLRQAFNLDQDDAMLEDGDNQLREHQMSAQFLEGILNSASSSTNHWFRWLNRLRGSHLGCILSAAGGLPKLPPGWQSAWAGFTLKRHAENPARYLSTFPSQCPKPTLDVPCWPPLLRVPKASLGSKNIFVNLGQSAGFIGSITTRPALLM